MNGKIYDAVIIGAGAAGLMAAITAARAGAQPILLEHMPQSAKKILATGNGKCNYTNADWKLENYYCEEPKFVQTVFAQFSYDDTIRFFEELGIRPKQKNGTCIYPESEQASSVRSALSAEVQRLHIPIILSIGIRAIRKIQRPQTLQENKTLPDAVTASESEFTAASDFIFEIQAKEQSVYGRTLILATGGKAAKKTGSDGSGYIYAKQLGHKIVEPLPALVALQADFKKYRLPFGVRIGCAAVLLVDGETAVYEQGELQITDYGISGIVVFQFSRIASRALLKRRQVQVLLDFKPEMAKEELASYLDGRFHSVYHAHKTLADCLIGFLPDKLIPVILQKAGLWTGMESKNCGKCSRKHAMRLAQILKTYDVVITGTKNFDSAQVTAGGVSVQEINPQTMESRLVPGLYFAGEIVDVDAKCGGYNLQWAWSSGYTAGKHCCGSAFT